MINQLVKIYFEHETWHKHLMPKEEAFKYHKRLLEKGNILTYTEKGRLLAYIEVWKLNKGQMDRLTRKEPFSGYLEDTTSGEIAYIANLWIREDVRVGHVIKILKLMFFNHIKNCKFVTGIRTRRNNRLEIFKNRG